MANVITVTPPLDQVVNVVGTPTTGGNLPADTYYIKICAANTSSYTLATADARRGKASVEIAVVLSGANNAISLNWDAVTDATHYNVYVRKSSEATYGSAHCWVSSSLAATINTNSFSVTDISKRAGGFDSFAYSDNYAIPGGIDRDQGTIVIHVESTHDNDIYYNVLESYVAAAGCSSFMSWIDGTFALKGQLIIDNGATGTMTMYYFNSTSGQRVYSPDFHFHGGIFQNNSPDFTINWGYTSSAASYSCVLYVATWSWRMDLQYMNCRGLSIHGGIGPNKLISQQYYWGGDNYVYLKGTVENIEGLVVRGVTIYIYEDTDGLLVDGAAVQFANNGNVLTVSNSTAAYAFVGGTYNNSKFVLKNCKLTRSSFAGHCRPRNPIDGGIEFSGCRFMDFDGTQLDDPAIYWESTAVTNKVYNSVPFNIHIAGGLSGFNVTVKDKNGNTVVNETTDSNGDITEQSLVMKEYTYDGSGSYGLDKTTTTLKYPFTMTISKAGYETQEFEFTPTLNKTFSATYGIKTQIPKLEDDNGDVFDRVDKTNSGSTNLRRKIVKN